MSEEILINITPMESRVALVENGVLQEVHVERTQRRGIVGNIYKGKVVRVLPGMQAAFIDIGLDRAAFIHASEISLREGPAVETITAGTWQAAYTAAQIALSGVADIQSGAYSAFSLCRPPGHHAAGDLMGGYCYLNNAAIAAQAFLDQGRQKVAILDVDYHHGNGTQSIFYDRNDVLFASIHGDPTAEFPFFLGYADETGEGAGQGLNFNYPLPAGSDWPTWAAALEQACDEIDRYAPDVIVVSLGVDTFKEDPISQFKLDSPDYLLMGERIARLGKPTLFVMEGGYAVEEIGINAVNVLEGFKRATEETA